MATPDHYLATGLLHRATSDIAPAPTVKLVGNHSAACEWEQAFAVPAAAGAPDIIRVALDVETDSAESGAVYVEFKLTAKFDSPASAEEFIRNSLP